MALQENLKSYQEKVIQKSLDSMNQLYMLAKQLDKKEAASNFQNLIEKLKSDKFNLAIIGRFKNGKSTFANALLGQPTNGRILNGDKGPMPTARTPCTAVLTYVRHTERPSVKALHMDGKTDEDWTFDRYLAEGRLKAEEINNEVFDNIKAFAVGFPSPLLKEGLILVDTPGIDENPKRTQVAREAVSKADAAIVVYSSNQPAGEAERAFVENQLIGTVSKVYTVVNMFFEADDEFLRSVWYRLVADKIKRPYDPAAFHEYGIYFVDALRAFKGKQASDLTAQRESGLIDFEENVSNFLTRERGKTHLLSSVFPAANSAKELANEIGNQQSILKADAEQFRQTLDSLRPRLAELKKRPDEVKKLFGYYEGQLLSKLKTSYEMMLLSLPQEFTDHMQKVEIPILKETGAFLLKPKECAAAVKAAAESFINRRFDEWMNEDAKSIVGKLMGDMTDELEEVFGKIKADTRFIELQLSKILMSNESISTEGKWDKLLGVAYGVIFLDPVVGFGGGSIGWKGMASSLAGRFAIALGVTMIGITGPLGVAVVAILGALLSLLIGENAGTRARKKIADDFLQIIEQNRLKMLSDLEKGVTENFAELTDPILELVRNQVSQDIEGIEQMARDNERGQAEKTTRIKQLERAKEDVLAQQKILSAIHLNV